MQQIMRCAIPGKRFGDLSRSPFRSGMGRHVEVNCATPMVAQHYKDEQDAKGYRRHHQKICRNQLLNVILKKRAPRL
jgi:hypothetical protein